MRPLTAVLLLTTVLLITSQAAMKDVPARRAAPELRLNLDVPGWENNDCLDKIILSPDGSRLAAIHEHNQQFIDRATGKVLARHLSCAENTTISPDGRRLALLHLATRRDGPPFGAWIQEVRDGEIVPLHTLKVDSPYAPRDCLRHASFSPDGKRLAAGTDFNVVHIWDVETGKLLRRFEGGAAVHFTRDGKTLVAVTQDGLVRRFDARTFRPLTTDPCERDDFFWVGSVVFAENDRFVALCDDYTIVIKDIQTGAIVSRFKLPRFFSVPCFFSPDGKMLAVAVNDRPFGLQHAYHFYEVASGRELGYLPNCVPQAGCAGYVARRDGRDIVIADLERAMTRLQPPPERVRSDPAGVPIVARLVARRQVYQLDLEASSPRQASENIVRERGERVPDVDLVLEFKNTGTEPVHLQPSIRECEPYLYLTGAGALNHPEYYKQVGCGTDERPPIKLAPGASFRLPIKLADAETRPHWLLPGQYEIGGKVCFSMSPAPAGVRQYEDGSCLVFMDIEPAKVIVRPARGDAARKPVRLLRKPGADVPPLRKN